MNEFAKLFFEKKRDLICETCGKEFYRKEVGEHAVEEHHYSFKLKGTNLHLGIL